MAKGRGQEADGEGKNKKAEGRGQEADGEGMLPCFSCSIGSNSLGYSYTKRGI
jgi:hypothetical protein